MPYLMIKIFNGRLTNKIASLNNWAQAFAFHWYMLYIPMILAVDSDDPDQTAYLHSLIWAFAVCACPKDTFWWGSKNP